MDRVKRLVLTSHCIVNQNSVVCPLARARGAFPIVKILLEAGFGMIQLPCPEFRYLGPERKPMSKKEYDTPEYRALCRNLFLPILEDIKKYIGSGYEIKAILGINQSPTCSITGNRGIFMEEIFIALHSENITIEYLEIPVDYSEENDSKVLTDKIHKLCHY